MSIHPTAIIHKGAQVTGDNIEIGPYSVVGEHVKLNPGVQIGAHCVIDGWTELGEGCKVFTGAVLGSIPQDLKYKGEKTFLKIGKNNIIREYCTINPGTHEGGGETVIGDNNLLMAYVHVAHDCRIGNNVIMANLGTLAGHVTIEDRAVLGGLAAIHQFVRIGRLCIIGGCSKVVQDVPPFSLVDGHPARIYGINSIGLKRAQIPLPIRETLKKALRILVAEGWAVQTAIRKIEKELPPSPELAHLVQFVRSTKRGIPH